MAVFKINGPKLELVKEKKIDLEKNIQKLTEDNLETVFGYQFIATELRVDNFRFDTLAWNPESKSFVIIEYKKDRNFSVVDQGFSYLSLLVNKKEFFLYEYFESTKKNLSRDEVDWSQSRVVFISPNFTPHQINSINFKNMAFDLYEVKMYDNGTVLYDPVKAAESSESIDLIMGEAKAEKIIKEITNYTIDDLFKPSWAASREIFDILDEKVMSLDPNIKRNIVKNYVGYKIDQKNLIIIKMFKSGPSIEFNRSQPSDFSDPEARVNYLPNSMKFYNQHISYFQLATIDDIDDAWNFIKQVYKRFMEKE